MLIMSFMQCSSLYILNIGVNNGINFFASISIHVDCVVYSYDAYCYHVYCCNDDYGGCCQC